MRKVLFKRWIPAVREKVGSNTYETLVIGTNCYDTDFIHKGMFHGWGVRHEELDTGVGNYTVALVELPDGTVEEVEPCNIKFTDKPPHLIKGEQ